MIGHEFPYLDTRDLNLDWLLKNMKQLLQDWATYQQTMNQNFANLQAAVDQFETDITTAFDNLHDYVEDYFDNLDVQQEINHKLDAMRESGELAEIMEPLVSDAAGDWLAIHITNPSNPPIDTSLSVPNAAADARVVGNRLTDINNVLDEFFDTTEDESEWGFSTETNAGILNTIRFSASLCELSGRLDSVKIKTRPEDTGSVSLCLAEIIGTSATVYAVIPITLHVNPATNIEYENGVDFAYSDIVRQNTIFGVWANSSKQINYGTDTVSSYYYSTETPASASFTLSDHTTNYNIAVSYHVTKTEPLVTKEEIDDMKSDLSILINTEFIESDWEFSTDTYAGIVNTARFSASLCASESDLESVKLKVRNADSGQVSICLAEVSGTTAEIYAVIPVTLHANPGTNIEYINGIDFEYTDKVRENTIFGIWANTSIQVNFGEETVKSYAKSTESPLNAEFSVASPNNYNIAVAFKTSIKTPTVKTIKKVVVFGDSWTDIVNTTYTRWPVLINELDDFDVTSYGVTGSAISSHVATQVNNFLAAPTSVDVFIMMGGINDYRGGTAYSSIVTAVETYYGQLHTAYPSARFIYLANNQLFFTQNQLIYFNSIVGELRRAGIEAYTMFGWVYPNQYATTDLLHVGNAGNKLIANNILALLRGGNITTVINKYHTIEVVDSTNAGIINIFETWNDGLPEISAECLCTSKLANQTFTRTINSGAMVLSVSASYALYPCQRANRDNFMTIYTPLTETLDSANQLTEFVLTFVVTTAGTIFTTPGLPRWYS